MREVSVSFLAGVKMIFEMLKRELSSSYSAKRQQCMYVKKTYTCFTVRFRPLGTIIGTQCGAPAVWVSRDGNLHG